MLTISPADENINNNDDIQIQKWIVEIQLEKENIRLFLMRKSFEIGNETALELLIHQYQASLISLADIVFVHLKRSSTSLMQVVYNALLSCFEDLLKHMEERYARYFNRNERVPFIQLQTSRKKMITKMKILRSILENNAIDEELIHVIISGIEELISGSVFITYNSIEYTKELMNDLQHIVDKNNLDNDAVIRVLIYLNFNYPDFISYFLKGIINDISGVNEQHEKISILNKHFKEINQMQIRPFAGFNNMHEAVKQQISTWINEEVFFLEQRQQIVPATIAVKEEGLIAEENKLHLSTSVEVLTLLARAGKDSKFILNKQMTGMFRSIARFCRTRNAESPAANSMLKKSYVADRMNKQKAIDVLHEMIKCIHRYCVVPTFIYYQFLNDAIELL